MKTDLRAFLTAAAVFILAGCSSSSPATVQENLATTTHSVQVNGERLRYTAYAGRLPVGGTAEAPHGRVFFIAYRMPSQDGRPRPVSFVWNGGPGADSALLHFEAFGPRLATAQGMRDNPYTLLPYTDLVFVDPIGTGFSRAERDEFEQEFYSTLGDQASIAAFITTWRARFDAEAAPTFLIGESFGTWRAAGVAEILEREGRGVDGVVLISGGAAVGPNVPREMRAAMHTPGRAAAALAHGRLPAQDLSALLTESESWAHQVYYPALVGRDQLSPDERRRVRADLARRIGVDEESIDLQSLAISPRDYLRSLLGREGKTLDTFDMRRIEGADEGEGGAAAVEDDYRRRTLRYQTELSYGGDEAINQTWDYNSGVITPEVMAAAMAGEGPPGAQPWSLNVVKLNPQFRILVAAGLYDSLNSCAANREIDRRLGPDVRDNFIMRCYRGGHMMYRNEEAHRRLSADVAAFVTGAPLSDD